MISTYSVCSAVIIFNIFLVFIFILQRRTHFLAQHTVALLLFISALGLVRLFTPIDFEEAEVVHSWHLLPAIQSAVLVEMPFLGVSIGTVLLTIWICGSIVFAVKDISTALQAQKTRGEYIYLEDKLVECLAAQLCPTVRVKVSSQVQEPYVAGVFKPVIYLPTMELTDDELFFILRHEEEHIRARDGLKKLLLLMIKWLFWFNPFAHISMEEADRLLELRCDERVTRTLDEEGKLRYAQSMITVFRLLAPGQSTSDLCTVHFVGNEKAIKQRFELLLTNERRRPKSTAVLYAVAVLTFALSYLVVIQPASEPPQIEEEVTITAENSYIVRENGMYILYFDGERCGQILEWALDAPPYSELKIIEEAMP